MRARLPRPLPGAQATAEQLLAWVANRWRFSPTTYFGPPDANMILDRVAAGGRFGSVEYAIVLSQALNAVEIPARRLVLYADGYHARQDALHHVTEAWIDDLGKWILLDGRNGATWRDGDGTPLSFSHRDAKSAFRLIRAGECSGSQVNGSSGSISKIPVRKPSQ